MATDPGAICAAANPNRRIDAWLVDRWEGELRESPFVFRHEPGALPAGYVPAGHWHPVKPRAGDRVFAIGEESIVAAWLKAG